MTAPKTAEDVAGLLAGTTPGPWRIGSKCEERGRTWIGGSNEHGGAVLPFLAIINWPDHADANARLIASAPDLAHALIAALEREAALLEALSTYADGCDWQSPPPHCDRPGHMCCKTARAALQKDTTNG